MTYIDDIARWVSSLQYSDVPDRVLDIARHQVASVFGAICAGAGCAGGRAVMDTVAALGDSGACTTLPDGAGRTFQSALLQNCSLSMALDYDDYLFLGHTGHSAVLASMAAAQMRGVSTKRMLTAQVAANELEGRLGGTVALGPHNGQMWAHIHLLGAAAVGAIMLGLDEEATANALGIAMSEPVYALFPGFMGPQSKLLIAAVPAITGLTAALLAEKGMTGSRTILEDEQGFWSHFSFLPLPFIMTGLGRSWVTDTIAFKPYPGCAYIDTSMDAIFALRSQFEEERGRALEPKEVRSIEVDASILTIAMDGMSSMYMDPSRLSPTNINFSLSVSLAIAIIAGEFSGAQLTEEFLTERREDILELASRVTLRHDASMTVTFIKAFDEAVDVKKLLSQVGIMDVLKARRGLSGHLSSVATMGPREALRSWQSLSPSDKSFLKGLFSLRSLLKPSSGYDLGNARFEGSKLPFGARVRLELKDGGVLETERSVPRGGPGDPGRLRVAIEKLQREAATVMSEKAAAKAVKTILSIEEHTADEVAAVVRAGRE